MKVDEIQRALRRDGYVILRRFFPWATVEEARVAAAKLVDKLAQDLLEQGHLTEAQLHAEEPFAKRLILLQQHLDDAQVPTLFRKELHMEELFDVFFEPKLLDLMMELTGAEEIRLFPNYSMRPKLPSCGLHAVAWHQDAGLSPDGRPNESPVEERMAAFGPHNFGLRMVNCWTSLVPATSRSGCMKFIPGTHEKGIVPHEMVGKYKESDPDGTDKPGVYSTQIVSEELEPELDRAINVETKPGDLVLFSNLLFHSNQDNVSPFIRWSIDWRYQDSSCSTHRPEQGHVARSLLDLDREVQSAEEWVALDLR